MQRQPLPPGKGALGAVRPSQNVPFQQPLCIYTERAPPQQLFKTQHSGLHGGTSKTNHLEKKTANSLQAISLLRRAPPPGIPDLKVTGKDLRGQRAERQSRERKERVSEEMFPARLQLFL